MTDISKPGEATRPAERPKRKPPAMALDMPTKGNLNVTLSGDFDRLKTASGSLAVMYGLVNQLAALGAPGRKADAEAANFALGFVDSMAPRDPAEALLFAQMAAIHQATMTLARRLNHVETLPQQDGAERALNKLARTFAAQVEALKRYRSTGQQKVVVEHVTVNEGGQAIVGTVTRGEGAKED